MKHRDHWRPTKFVIRDHKLTASRDPADVSVSSRMFCDLLAAHFQKRLSEHASGRMLDLGCAAVPLFEAYKDLVTDVTCVDWSDSVHNNVHLDLEWDLSKPPLPFASESFDTILLTDVLEHLPEPELLCKEISRLLAVNGKVLITVPFMYWVHEEPHDYYRYTRFALQRFVERAGLCLLELTPIGGAPEVVTDILAKNLLLMPVIGESLSRLSQWTTTQIIQTKLGKKISVATREEFPLQYFLVAQKLS